MPTYPKSPLEKVAGLYYFARMLDKIRLQARGELPEDYHANLGQGADGLCCAFLHLDYATLKARVLEGGADEEIFAWAQEHGRRLNEKELFIWNSFITKMGWNDVVSPRVRRFKEQAGIAHRDDLQTMTQFIEWDEGRLQ